MEGELWKEAYRVVREEGNRQPPGGRVRHSYSDAVIVLVLLWAALHDRPVSWACDERHWAGCGRGRRPRLVPSAATMSRRLRTVGVLGLLGRVLGRLGDKAPPALVRRVDGKPLPVGGFSKDRDARWGQAVDHKARGYKLFLVWGGGVVPDAWTLGPMGQPEPVAAARELVPKLAGGGYLLGDGLYDSKGAARRVRRPRVPAGGAAEAAARRAGALPARAGAAAEHRPAGDGGARRPARHRARAVRAGTVRPPRRHRAGAGRVVQLRRRAGAPARLGPHPAPRRILVGREAADQRPAPMPPARHRRVSDAKCWEYRERG